MDDWERRQKLEEALRHAVEERQPSPAEQRMQRRAPRDRSPAGWIAVLIAGWACLAWIWLARPAFVFGPPEPPPPTVEEQEASLRFAMFLQRARVEAYRAARGRLPAALPEAGPVEDGVSYQRLGPDFVITGTRGGLSLRLTTAMDADSFLGRSIEVLSR